jgi:nitrate reductase NapAB chaperone NapD
MNTNQLLEHKNNEIKRLKERIRELENLNLELHNKNGKLGLYITERLTA